MISVEAYVSILFAMITASVIAILQKKDIKKPLSRFLICGIIVITIIFCVGRVDFFAIRYLPSIIKSDYRRLKKEFTPKTEAYNGIFIMILLKLCCLLLTPLDRDMTKINVEKKVGEKKMLRIFQTALVVYYISCLCIIYLIYSFFYHKILLWFFYPLCILSMVIYSQIFSRIFYRIIYPEIKIFGKKKEK